MVRTSGVRVLFLNGMNQDTVVCVNEQGERVDARKESLEFRPSVYGVVIRDGAVLLSAQWDGYDFPGGAVEKGETLEEALVREVKEETGVMIAKGDLLYMTEQFFVHPVSKKCFHAILFYYKCEYAGGDISTDNFTAEEASYIKPAEWVPLEKVDQKLKFYNPTDSVALIGLAAALSHS